MPNKTFVIYAIVHTPSDSLYIGATSKSPAHRFAEHACAVDGKLAQLTRLIRGNQLNGFRMFILCECDERQAAERIAYAVLKSCVLNRIPIVGHDRHDRRDVKKKISGGDQGATSRSWIPSHPYEVDLSRVFQTIYDHPNASFDELAEHFGCGRSAETGFPREQPPTSAIVSVLYNRVKKEGFGGAPVLLEDYKGWTIPFETTIRQHIEKQANAATRYNYIITAAALFSFVGDKRLYDEYSEWSKRVCSQRHLEHLSMCGAPVWQAPSNVQLGGLEELLQALGRVFQSEDGCLQTVDQYNRHMEHLVWYASMYDPDD